MDTQSDAYKNARQKGFETILGSELSNLASNLFVQV